MSLLTLTVTSGIVLLALSTLFIIEKRRGVRYAERVRHMLDQSVDASIEAWKRNTPHFRSHFWKQLFHFVTHKLLSILLAIVHKVEEYIHRAAHFNRKQARRVTESKPSEHLTQIAEHKESAQLSEREKKARKDKALRGE